MKKIYTVLFGAVVIAASPTKVNAQAVEQGSIIVDTYYGFGTLTTAILKAVTDNSTAKVSSLGPIGARFEYMVSDKIGVGLDGHHVQNTVTWTDQDTSGSGNYSYEVKRSVIRIMPRMNIHFGGGDAFDAYFGIGAGWRQANFSSKSNDPNYSDESLKGVNPFAFRVALGARYFFTDNIGLNMEFGLGGGAMIHGGITAKF